MVQASRLVTLTGPPGVGKSRLALEVAAAMVDSQADGVWLVELAPVTEPGLVMDAVAAVLGVQEIPGQNLVEAIVDVVADKRLVLVVDSCEHLLSTSAKAAATLLRACRTLIVLATSREPLGIEGESVWRVQPFALPPPDVSPDALLEQSAVRLFADRAAAVRPGFCVSAEEAAAVIEICRCLDGLPLAIELAAARMDGLSSHEIVEQLHQGLGVLNTRGRGEPSRHKTLDDTLDWSLRLLLPTEAALLARLSVFTGSWSLEAAQAICSGGEIAPGEVLGLLDSLVRKSLVTAEVGACETRFCFLRVIREHAQRGLDDSAGQDATRALHCRWYVRLAEEVAGERSAFPRLEGERENLRAAFSWSIAQGDEGSTLGLAVSLVFFWQARGEFEEGRRWLSRALEFNRGTSPLLRAKALWGAGLLAMLAGSMAEAIPLAEESLALATACGDEFLVRRARSLIGLVSSVVSPIAALTLLQSNVAMAREQGDARFLVASIGQLGHAHLLVGELEAARRCLDEALRLEQEEGDLSGEAGLLRDYGRLALLEGDYGTAEARLEEAMSIAEGLAEHGEVAEVLSWQGELARGRGDLTLARELLEKGMHLARAAGGSPHVARCLCGLGHVALAAGEPTAARTHLENALVLGRAMGRPFVVARCLLGLGEGALLDGDGSVARTTFDAALLVSRGTGDRPAVAAALHGLAGVAAQAMSSERARTLYQEALSLMDEVGDLPGLARSLEGLAILVGGSDRPAEAVRLLAAAQDLRDAGGYGRTAAATTAREASLQQARCSLGEEQLRLEWAKGVAMSPAQAVAYAVRRPGSGPRPSTGWASLTPAEHDVARFAAEGLSDREIGERLFISPRTVGSHLGRVFEKLGIRSRRELAAGGGPATP